MADVIVVMGVAGAGKSTVGSRLADALAVPFADGDGFHPEGNIAKMASGRPLDDDDRARWLAAVAGWIADHAGADGGVVACSALKRRYRDVLRAAAPDVWFVHLAIARPEAVRRVGGRPGHFMPVTLVDSQLAELEPLRDGERGVTVDASGEAAETVGAVLEWWWGRQRDEGRSEIRDGDRDGCGGGARREEEARSRDVNGDSKGHSNGP